MSSDPRDPSRPALDPSDHPGHRAPGARAALAEAQARLDDAHPRPGDAPPVPASAGHLIRAGWARLYHEDASLGELLDAAYTAGVAAARAAEEAGQPSGIGFAVAASWYGIAPQMLDIPILPALFNTADAIAYQSAVFGLSREEATRQVYRSLLAGLRESRQSLAMREAQARQVAALAPRRRVAADPGDHPGSEDGLE